MKVHEIFINNLLMKVHKIFINNLLLVRLKIDDLAGLFRSKVNFIVNFIVFSPML